MIQNNKSVTMQALVAAAEARMPVMIVGAPGIGKTATIRSMAKEMGYELISLIGSQMDPTDVTGLPKGEIISNDNPDNPVWGTVYLAPWWQVRILREKKVILFLDEFSNSSSAVQAAMLVMLQNREFPNGQTMPEETIIIGAMNPTDQAADGWDLAKPTTNRLFFLKWDSPQDEWFEGMLTAFGATIDDEEKYWRSNVVKFLKENPSFIHKENKDGGTPEAYGVNIDDSSELEVLRYAWASRRSWDNLTKVLAKTDRRNSFLQDKISQGIIGRASSVSFREWLMKNAGVVTPEDVINNPNNVDWEDIDVSEANIIFREIVELTNQNNWKDVLRVLDVVARNKQYALVGAFITDIIKKVVSSARKAGREEENEARKIAQRVVAKFNNYNKSEQSN